MKYIFTLQFLESSKNAGDIVKIQDYIRLGVNPDYRDDVSYFTLNMDNT